ncbi:MAG: hypothetical protein ACTHLB_20735 [Parafilimonas sp.]
MKRNFSGLLVLAIILLLSSCVAKRKLLDAQMQYRTLQNDSSLMASKIAGQQSTITKLQADIDALNKQNNQLSTDASNKVN